MRPLLRLLLLALLILSSRPLHAADEFLPGAKRILFLGDSITYAGQYVDQFTAFVFTQQPQRDLEIINCGLPSETVSGLSEEGHAGGKFPRPDLHERLDRVLSKVKPDLIFACYGMNDGIYLPLSDDRFKAFQDGMKKLHDKAVQAGAQIIHLTPPVFDALPIAAKVAPADKADGAHPYAGYDEVLAKYAEWLLAQRAQGWRVIDLHGPMLAAIIEARKTQPDFTFAKDGIHPNDAGHTEMARPVLATLATPAQVTAFAAFLKAPPAGYLPKVRQYGRLLTDAWLGETGHQRPGMAKGLPLPEAQAKAAPLAAELRGKN